MTWVNPPSLRSRRRSHPTGSHARQRFGIYFFGPEGNRNEVYLRIGRDMPPPFRKTLNLDREPGAVHAEAERQLTDGAPTYQPVAGSHR